MAGKAGIGKVALYGREYLVAIRPQKKGLVMYTLHHDAEIRSIDQVEELIALPAAVKPDALKLAKQVVSTFDADLSLKDYKDDYSDALRAIIESKIAGQEVITPEIASPGPVVDLMEALRKSLGAATSAKKKPAKARLESVKAKPAVARRRRAS